MTADNGSQAYMWPNVCKFMPFEIVVAKEDKISESCQGKLLDCCYIRDYGVD